MAEISAKHARMGPPEVVARGLLDCQIMAKDDEEREHEPEDPKEQASNKEEKGDEDEEKLDDDEVEEIDLDDLDAMEGPDA